MTYSNESPAGASGGASNLISKRRADTQKYSKSADSAQGSSEVVLAEICKNNMETIRVVLSNFKGRDIINIRVWNVDADENLHPTSKGIACSVRHIPALREALERAEALALASAGKGGAA